MEVRDATEWMRDQQGLREGASCEHPAGAEMRRLLRAVGSKHTAKSNKHRMRTVSRVLQLRGLAIAGVRERKEEKSTPQKYVCWGRVFTSFILICLYCAYHMFFTFFKKKKKKKESIRSCQWNPVGEKEAISTN